MAKKYRLIIHKDKCLGCGTCAALQPKYFKMDGQISVAAKEVVVEGEDDVDAIKEVVDTCPNEGIELKKIDE